MKTYFYDIEIFKNFFCVTFIDLDTNPDFIKIYEIADYEKNYTLKRDILNQCIKPIIFIISEYRNDLPLILDFFSVHKTIVGYNSHNYDDNIINYFLMNSRSYNNKGINKETGRHITEDLYELSQLVINYGTGYKYLDNKTKYYKPPYWSKDIQKLLYLDKKFVSLKQVAIQLQHYRIQDLPLPYWEKVTPNDENNIIDYNINDVIITYKLYKNQETEVNLREFISEEYGVNVRSESRSGSANKLIAKFYAEYTGMDRWEFINLRTERKIIKFNDIIFNDVKFTTPELNKFLTQLKTKSIIVGNNTLSEKVTFDGKAYTFATGGLHSVDKPNIFRANERFKYKDADVGSFYPSIIITRKIAPKHLDIDTFIEILKMLTDERLEAKSLSAKLNKLIDSIPEAKEHYEIYKNKADALKIVINAIYGKLGDANSFLYDLKAMYKVTINGQLYLLMLIEMLAAAGIQCISANTDGIVCKIPVGKEEMYHSICKQWEETTKFNLEYTEYEKYVCYGVNSYIAFKKGYADSDKSDKAKAKYIKTKNDFVTDIQIDKGYANPVVPKALLYYFADGIPIDEFIRNHDNIYDFCISIKTGEDFQKEYHTIKDGQKVITDLQKNVRYYISNEVGVIMKRYKTPIVDAKGIRREYIALHSGVNSTIFNDYIPKADMKEYKINYSYYIKEAMNMVYEVNNQVGKKQKKQAYGGLFADTED